MSIFLYFHCIAWLSFAETIVKVTPKKGAAKKLTAKITVKNPSVAFTDDVTAVAVGATETVKAAAVPTSAKVKYYSADKNIATVGVTSGVVTGVKAGTVKIAAKFYSGKKEVKVYKEITVKDVILKDVKQATTTKLTATVAGNTANIKASDIVITNTYSKANFAVKSVSVDKNDKTQVTIETYVPMSDGKDYTVTLADVTKTITVTDGKIVNATIAPATVVVPTPANNSDGSNANDLVAKFTDAQGVEIISVKPTSATIPTGFTYVEWKVDATNNGYLSKDTLNLYKVGNTAKVTVIAHTGKYDASAQETGNVTAETTISGVDPTAVTTTGWNVKVGTTADNKAATEFKNVKEAKVAVGDTAAAAYVQRTQSDNKVADASTGYDFESSDIDVMTVAKLGSIKDATAIAVKPYKVGNAYIIVKDSKTKAVVTTLPVTVVAERKVTTLTLDKHAFILSSKSGIDPNAEVKVTAKDQYGEESPITTGVTCKNANTKIDDSAKITVAANKITVLNPGLDDKGNDSSNTYIVEYKDVKVTFTIVVKKAEAGDASSYDLVLDADKVDAIIKDSTDPEATIGATVWGYDKNGVKVEKVDGSDVKWSLEKDGKTAKDAEDVTTGTGIVSLKVNNFASGKQMAAGVYTLKAEYKTKLFVKTFEITNSQPAATASLKDTSVTSGTTLKDNLKVVYNGNEVAAADYSITSVNGKAATDAYDITGATNIAKVTLKIKVATGKYVEKEITIGKTIILK